MEYRLSRLSSRSFEKLVQALSVGVLGSGVVVFGDGADGGREAVYSGLTQFAPTGIPWDGLTIVQAKFRQRPLGTEIDGPWAVQSLAEELSKFASSQGGRQRPEFYLFVTNAVLSPNVGGTKDQANALLEKATSDWGLKGYDVWDYDKLQTLLDRDSEVRTRFGWITAGDVLGEMFASLTDSSPDFEPTITNYLEKSLVNDRFARLEEAGFGADDPTALSQVFVDVPVEGHDPSDRDFYFVQQVLNRAAPDPRAEDDRTDEDSSNRLVLVGGPGQGKTTVAQFVCQLMRAELLASRQSVRLSPEGRQAMHAVIATAKSSGFPISQCPRIPVRVVLTDLARVLADDDVPLLSYLAARIGKRAGRELRPETLRRWLPAAPWFLVLDGLDEVGAGADRDRVMACVEAFWVDVAQAGADVFVLATTRPQGYNDAFSPARYEHLRLAELPTSVALEYGTQLSRARYGEGNDRSDTVEGRLTQASESEMTAHLMKSPLQVAIMTALVDRYGQPPNERWSLFDAYYDVIYQRERERDSQASRVLRGFRSHVDAIHRMAGLVLQVVTNDGHSDPRLTSAQLRRLVDARLATELEAGPGRDEMAAAIQAAAEMRLVFLVGAESDRIGFEIRSLQEFMAAGALVSGSDRQVLDRLRQIAPLPGWRNVFLFAAGECYVRKEHLRGSIQSICRELDVDLSEPLVANGKFGAGLALDMLEDRTAGQMSVHQRTFATHALEYLAVADESTARRLSDCYTQALDDLYRSALADGAASPDPILATNALRTLVLLADRCEWARPLIVENLPTRSQELVAVLDDWPHEATWLLPASALRGRLGDLSAAQLARIARGPLAPTLGFAVFEPQQSKFNVLAGPPGFSLDVSLVGTAAESATDRQPSDLDSSLLDDPVLCVHRAAWEFARNPSRDGLASAFDAATKHTDVPSRRRARGVVPWPLGLALYECDETSGVEAVRTAICAGEFGDEDEWTSAEDRWRSGPVDLVAEVSMGRLGFPFVLMGATSRADAGSLHLVNEVRSIVKTAPEAGAVLAEIVLWLLGLHGSDEDEAIPASTVAELLRCLATDTKWLAQVGVLDVDPSDPDLTEVLDAMEGVHFTVGGSEYRLPDGIVEELERLVEKSPSIRTAEALAFSYASTDKPANVRVPDVTLGDAYGDACLEFLRFLGGAADSSAVQLGAAVGAAANDRSKGLAPLIGSEVTRRSQEWHDFFVGILTTFEPNWIDGVWLTAQASGLISRRKVGFSTPEGWRATGLADPSPNEVLRGAYSGR